MTGFWGLWDLISGGRLRALRARHAKAAETLDAPVREISR